MAVRAKRRLHCVRRGRVAGKSRAPTPPTLATFRLGGWVALLVLFGGFVCASAAWRSPCSVSARTSQKSQLRSGTPDHVLPSARRGSKVRPVAKNNAMQRRAAQVTVFCSAVRCERESPPNYVLGLFSLSRSKKIKKRKVGLNRTTV